MASRAVGVGFARMSLWGRVEGLGVLALAAGCASSPAQPMAGDARVEDALGDRGDVAALAIRGLAQVPRVAPRCAVTDEAPLRTGDDVDAIRCTAVGASATPGAPAWPEVANLPDPVLYVDPAAGPDGDGTRQRPLTTIARALAWTPAARAVVLARGTHPVGETLRVSRDLAIVGAGALGGSVVEITRARAGIVVGAAARVSLSGLSLRFAQGAPLDADVALASEAGALTLRDVSVDDASVALDLAGGSLDAERITLRRSARAGVRASGNASVALTRFLVRDGAGQGIRAENAHVRLTQGLVAGNGRHGVVLLGAADATGGRARCGEAGPGAIDCIDQLVSQGNGVAALYVTDARRLEVRRSTLADTALTAIEGGEAGDGIFVGPDADLSLDPELISPAVRGFGSAVLGNGRGGLVAQGIRARVAIRGAVFARNASGGAFIGSRAQVSVIGESIFVENRFAGIVATPGAEVGIVQCNGIADTLAGSLRTATATVQLADGVHLNATGGTLALRENAILRSGAFGLLVNAGQVALERNRGADNRFGVGIYGGATIMGDPSSIVGREVAPAVAPGLVPGL
ncbi:MAG: right-handed parallel beta-helix repeat-containing protein [Polyangiales bacterium]